MFKPNPIGLSVQIVVKNGTNPPNDIRRCVESVAEVADEIFVVDRNSYDGTYAELEMLRLPLETKNLTVEDDPNDYLPSPMVRIHRYSREVGRLEARTWALNHACGAWVLLLNGNEWLDSQARERIRRIVREDLAGEFGAENEENRIYTCVTVRERMRSRSEQIRLFPNLSGLYFALNDDAEEGVDAGNLQLNRLYENMPPIAASGIEIYAE